MKAATNGTQAHCEIRFTRPTTDTLCVQLVGKWSIHVELPSTAEVEAQLGGTPRAQRLMFDTQELTGWDSGLLTFLLKLDALGAQSRIAVDHAGLPQGVQRLLQLATAVPERAGARRGEARESVVVRLGKWALAALDGATEMLAFLGQMAQACGKLLRGRASFRRADFVLILQDCGAQALPIVSLISFLVGLILAFVGAVQLRQFGAQIYVANLVALAMVREMAAIMTGIIMAGRTGAAFAAQLGTMTVNQEIDALSTMGISPMEFLVLPRMLALVCMVPLLCIYADIVGILGGAVIGIGMLNLGPEQYYQQTVSALTLTHVVIGLIKGGVFGVLVALAGCMRGMQSGRSASAVGAAATSAVVTAIVWIIVCDAVATVICDVLGV
ncbi:MAG TPA: ABC transporter permease [Candidatus Tectomicrobia bacterium]